MAKTTGMGDRLFVGGYDLSGDVGAVDRISGSHALITNTGIDKSAVERIGGIRDGAVNFSAWFDTVAGAEHAVLTATPTADRHITYLNGQAAGNAGAAMIGKQVTYDLDLAEDGALAATIDCPATNGTGLEWGVQLTTGKQTMTGAANGSDVDDLAGSPTSTAFGAAAYLQVFSVVGTSATILVADAATLPTYTQIGGMTFGAVTPAMAPYCARVTTTGATDTIRRYVRVQVTGTFSSLVFSLLFVRYRVAIS